MQRPRHGSAYKWKRGRWTREEYGSTWLFRARSDRSSLHFPTNSAPGTGERKGRRFSRLGNGDGWENSSRRTPYWYHIYRKIASLEMFLDLASRDEQWYGGKGKRECKIRVLKYWRGGDFSATNFPPIRRIIFFFFFFVRCLSRIFKTAGVILSQSTTNNTFSIFHIFIFFFVRKRKKLFNDVCLNF